MPTIDYKIFCNIFATVTDSQLAINTTPLAFISMIPLDTNLEVLACHPHIVSHLNCSISSTFAKIQSQLEEWLINGPQVLAQWPFQGLKIEIHH